ncbi:MAG: hypothetical protein ACKOZY_12985, partial [Flavobacteriales bacterium]
PQTIESSNVCARVAHRSTESPRKFRATGTIILRGSSILVSCKCICASVFTLGMTLHEANQGDKSYK